jgi:hypothetical protein
MCLNVFTSYFIPNLHHIITTFEGRSYAIVASAIASKSTLCQYNDCAIHNTVHDNNAHYPVSYVLIRIIRIVGIGQVHSLIALLLLYYNGCHEERIQT